MNFKHDGFLIVRHFIPTALIHKLRNAIRVYPQSDVHRPAISNVDPLTIDGSGSEDRYKQIILGNCLQSNSDIAGLYVSVAETATLLLQRPLEPGPNDAWASCVNVNLYTRPGDRQGWHVDTNPVSALLFLSSPADAPLVLGDSTRPIPTEAHAIVPVEGDLVLLDGSRPHRVSPIQSAERINISFNLYDRSNYVRPLHTDALLYPI